MSAPRSQMDAANWAAVVECCDEIAGRIPEGSAMAEVFESKVCELREIAKRERAYALLGTGMEK